MESLSDRLKALGVQIGTSKIPPKPLKVHRVEDVIEGYDQETPFGSVFVYEEDYDPTYEHGISKLTDDLNLEIISKWSRATSQYALDYRKFIFLDAETSGLAGGTGTFAFMVGLGFLDGDRFHVVQLFMRNPSLEPGFLTILESYISGFEGIVTFNGKSFDVPLLRTRYILNGMTSPFERLHHVDVLLAARRIWRKRLENCRLSFLESEILGVRRNQEEVPGWLIPEIYFDYLKTGDAEPLAGVFYHNRFDILSLAGLFSHIAVIYQNPLSVQTLQSLDLMSLARLNEDLGRLEEAILLYRLSLERGDLPRFDYIQTLLKFAILYKKHDNWSAAMELWMKATELDSAEACIELAKYYEHEVKNVDEALLWSERAKEILFMPSSGRGSISADEIQNRINRLVTKKIGSR